VAKLLTCWCLHMTIALSHSGEDGGMKHDHTAAALFCRRELILVAGGARHALSLPCEGTLLTYVQCQLGRMTALQNAEASSYF
jgi:hypothetical protein